MARQAVEFRHLDIHGDDVGLEVAGELHRLAPVARLADHGHLAVGLDDAAQDHAHEGRIVDHEDATPRRDGLAGAVMPPSPPRHQRGSRQDLDRPAGRLAEAGDARIVASRRQDVVPRRS